jgi:hypothetical protein
MINHYVVMPCIHETHIKIPVSAQFICDMVKIVDEDLKYGTPQPPDSHYEDFTAAMGCLKI